MKRFFLMLLSLLCVNVHADTINLNWIVDDSVVDRTTCETGGDLTLSNVSPTKYGYHFVGWDFSTIMGTWSQTPTPTPTDPVDPVFYPLGNTVLRAVGVGDQMISDSYDPQTNTITRRIGVKAYDGNIMGSFQILSAGRFRVQAADWRYAPTPMLCTHFVNAPNSSNNTIYRSTENSAWVNIRYDSAQTLQDFEDFLIEQNRDDNPVTFYYVKRIPTTEAWSPSAQ